MGLLSDGGVRTYALGGGAIEAGGGGAAAVEFDGDTGTELTWMTSSWKSAGAFVLFALSILSIGAVGSGVGGLTRSFLFGLACL